MWKTLKGSLRLLNPQNSLLPSLNPYLLGEVFGHPGFVVSRSLLLLPSLSLLQPVFVLRGLVNVPVLQRLGDMLP